MPSAFLAASFLVFGQQQSWGPDPEEKTRAQKMISQNQEVIAQNTKVIRQNWVAISIAVLALIVALIALFRPR